ncbi:MAG: hypothetical protein M0R49_08590, partial [Limnochordia bacterium]|nr:hypothetical protein [Limnochordia bacterium]
GACWSLGGEEQALSFWLISGYFCSVSVPSTVNIANTILRVNILNLELIASIWFTSCSGIS